MNLRLNWLVLVLVVWSFSAQAETRRRRASVPLMPADQGESESYSPSHSSSPGAWRLGLGVGTLLRSQQTNSDLLGFEASIGLRGLVWIPIAKRWTLVPSIGAFMRSEGNATLAVQEFRFEFGGSVLYTVVEQPRWNFYAGLAQRGDIFFSRIVAGNAAQNSPVSGIYRLGPEVQIDTRLTEDLRLWGSIEATVSLQRPSRLYPAGFIGIQFEM